MFLPALLVLALAAPAPAPPQPALRLVDVASERGLAFRHDPGVERLHYLAEATGSGTCAFDADGDGDDDILLVNGGVLDPATKRPRQPNRLFLNDGTGRFRDAGPDAGVAGAGFGMGCMAADVEGDGDLDVLVTGLGPDQLLLNDGRGRFRDVAATAGVADPRWTTAAGFADGDGDGDLDLYVGAYVDQPLDGRWCDGPKGLKLVCRPFDYAPLPNRLYRNDGVDAAGIPRFADVTAASGAADAQGKALGLLFEDLSGDGRADLFVANDTTRSTYLEATGALAFEDRSLKAGLGLSAIGRPQASMGIDAGDLDGDGRDEVAVTNFQGETNTIWSLRGGGPARDVTDSSGMGAASLPMLGFGMNFADLDLDGDLDVIVANGHVDDRIAEHDPRSTFAQRVQVLENAGAPGALRLIDRPAAIVAREVVGRGTALLDLEGDGDLDVVVNALGGEPLLLENRAPARSWIQVELRQPGANPRAIGARVEVVAGGRTQARRIRTASSYLSSSPPRASFGLGDATTARVRVTWPDGFVQDAGDLAARQRHVVTRPTPTEAAR